MSKSKKSVEDIATSSRSIPQKNSCERIEREMEAALQKQCRENKNRLPKCCNCRTKKGIPSIRSQSDAALLNTGHNGSGGVFDVGDKLLSWGTKKTRKGKCTPAFVTKHSAWDSPFLSAAWISDSENAASKSDEIFFCLKFSICDNIDLKSFALSVDYLVDDDLIGVSINGVEQSISIPDDGFKVPPSTILLKNNWKHCDNEVIFHVGDGGSVVRGFLAKFSLLELKYIEHNCDCACTLADLPDLAPCLSVSYGGGDGHKPLDTNDCEVLCITACNCFGNMSFKDLKINLISVLDENGKLVPNLPDGSPTVEVVPFSPICFGDLDPCDRKGKPNCKSRQVAIHTRGAKAGKYRLKLEHICYQIEYTNSTSTCFEFNLCKD